MLYFSYGPKSQEKFQGDVESYNSPYFTVVVSSVGGDWTE